MPRDLPHVWNGHEVDGWSITGYYNDELTCRNVLLHRLLRMPAQGFPEGKETAEVIAWAVEGVRVSDEIASEEHGYGGPMPYNRPLYRADVRIPVIPKGDGDE